MQPVRNARTETPRKFWMRPPYRAFGWDAPSSSSCPRLASSGTTLFLVSTPQGMYDSTSPFAMLQERQARTHKVCVALGGKEESGRVGVGEGGPEEKGRGGGGWYHCPHISALWLVCIINAENVMHECRLCVSRSNKVCVIMCLCVCAPSCFTFTSPSSLDFDPVQAHDACSTSFK